MDNWERFDEASLPDNNSFYKELNLEDITDHEPYFWYMAQFFNSDRHC